MSALHMKILAVVVSHLVLSAQARSSGFLNVHNASVAGETAPTGSPAAVAPQTPTSAAAQNNSAVAANTPAAPTSAVAPSAPHDKAAAASSDTVDMGSIMDDVMGDLSKLQEKEAKTSERRMDEEDEDDDTDIMEAKLHTKILMDTADTDEQLAVSGIVDDDEEYVPDAQRKGGDDDSDDNVQTHEQTEDGSEETHDDAEETGTDEKAGTGEDEEENDESADGSALLQQDGVAKHDHVDVADAELAKIEMREQLAADNKFEEQQAMMNGLMNVKDDADEDKEKDSDSDKVEGGDSDTAEAGESETSEQDEESKAADEDNGDIDESETDDDETA